MFIYDIECLKNFFCIVFRSRFTDITYIFEISSRKNQINELIQFLEKKGLKLIGFNNLEYDYPLIHFILENKKILETKSYSEVLNLLYQESQKIISSEYSSIPFWKIKIPQLDLYKIWHFDNDAKRTSLKKLEFALRLPNVQDMPYKHDSIFPENCYDEIIDYCKNDVEATYQFFLVTIGETELKLYKGKNKLALRQDIYNKFGIDCFNWNDVKIGDEINKITYLKLTGKDKSELKGVGTHRKEIHFKDCISPFIKFNSKELSFFLENLKKIVVNGTKSEFKEVVTYKGVTFTFGQGGIHSVDLPRMITVSEGWILEDRDVSSMYPSTIIELKLYPAHLGPEWLEGYIWIYNTRITEKNFGNKDAHPNLSEKEIASHLSVSETYKLSLNGGGYGKTGEKYSWQYDPLVMLTTTITNQLALLMLAEQYLDEGFKVISANTDGIVLLYPEDKKDIVKSIDTNWMNLTKYKLEYTQYSKFIQTSVNDYITLKSNGDIKFKGDFEIDKELHKNHSMKIVPMALKEYFINNIPVEKTIKECTDIYDFCKSANMTGKNILCERISDGMTIEDRELSKTTRYYVSNDGYPLIKILPPKEDSKLKDAFQMDLFTGQIDESDDRETNIEAGYVCTIFNRYIKKPINEYNINYDYYIKECNKIIEKIIPNYLEKK